MAGFFYLRTFSNDPSLTKCFTLSTSLGHGFRDQTDDVAAAHLDGDAEGDEVLLRALARLGHRSDADHSHVMKILFFAHSVRIKLASPQAAQLSLPLFSWIIEKSA